MSGLHTRGYRPEPGERAGSWFRGEPVGARILWPAWWGHVRVNREDPDRREDGTLASRLNQLARECLDAREAPDPLFAAAHARQVIRLGSRVRGQQRAIGAALAGPLRDMVERLSLWGETSRGLRNDLGGEP